VEQGEEEEEMVNKYKVEMCKQIVNVRKQSYNDSYYSLKNIAKGKSIEIDQFQMNYNKFDTNKDASNKCEDERIFLNLMEFT
jgi:hypothetical protein